MAQVRILLVLVIAVCWMVEVQSQPDPAVCTLHGPDTKGVPLPALPEQFRLRVEANILGWNRTVEVVEYYDNINNLGMVHSIRGGKISQMATNYNTEEIVSVLSDGSCNVHNLTAGGFNAFGFQLLNGTAHIGSVTDILRFGATFNETYMGTTYVRGIPVNHWQSCLYEEHRNATSILDYYFTIPGYSSSYGDAQIPLRLALNGTASNARFINGKVVNVNGSHTYSHIYEFFDVEFHPIFADRTFEPPLGTVCPNRKSQKPLPAFPDRFRMGQEIVIPDMKSVYQVSEMYNYQAKIVAYLFKMAANGTHPATPYRLLDDFNTGLTYRINMTSGSCSIMPIALFSPDAISPDRVHVQMRSVASFFEIGSQDWQYQGLHPTRAAELLKYAETIRLASVQFPGFGWRVYDEQFRLRHAAYYWKSRPSVSQLRDMDVESWITVKTDWKPEFMFNSKDQVNSTWEYYFTAASWNTESGLSKSSIMPVRAKIQWTTMTDAGIAKNGSYIINYFHFDTDVAVSHFDLSPCFGSVDRQEMAFDLVEMGVYNQYIANNTVEFHHGVAYSIAVAAKVTPTRISHIYASEDNTGTTTVFFTILGVPDVKGDAVDMIEQLPLADALANLVIVMTNQFFLKFNHNGKEMSFEAKSLSLRYDFAYVDETTDSQQFSTGAFVGFGFAMLVIGALVAVGIIIFLGKKRIVEVPYNVQS